MGAMGEFLVGHRNAIRYVLAAYFIVVGTLGARSMIVGTTEKYEDFTKRSKAFRFGVYLRELFIYGSDVVLGALILKQVSWAKTFGIALLAASTVYSARGFAWGFAKGKPSGRVFLLSLAGFCLWNGLLIYVLYTVL